METIKNDLNKSEEVSTAFDSSQFPFPDISPNALRVLEKRYLAKNEEGKTVETPQELFMRVAKNIATAELKYPLGNFDKANVEFYQLMANLEFLPNSPTLMNAGRDLQQLSACFVLPVEDSMEGIFEVVKQAAIIHKTGGGTGFSFTRLRPKDDVVKTTGGVASGPVSFMKVFNHATEAVKQGGTRRGANMGILRVDHPDILDFISCKDDTKEITNFNISVAITDNFMEAVRRNESYDLISPRSKKAVKQMDARMVFDKIASQAHKNGEPGLFFIDPTNRTNPTPHISEMEATNPCGEQPLLPYESCNLGSINLEKHLIEKEGQYEINWIRLEKSIRTSVHFLDNVIDMNKYPIAEIEKITKSNRKIGLGIMGFARILYKLGIGYDTEAGVDMGRKIMAFFKQVGYDASRKLAEERGVYANWKGSLHEQQGHAIRNSYVTTVAPTGTISMIADTSGGCEPEFSLIWYKNVMGGEHLPYVQDYFIEVAKREGFWYEGLLEKIIANHGSSRGIKEIPPKWQEVFVTSHDIAPEWHVRMQAAFQEHTDSAVSKTINLSSSATVEDVKKAYLLAYRLNCKGITVYRDGSRDEQVMNLGTSSKNQSAAPAATPSPTKSVTVNMALNTPTAVPQAPASPLIQIRPRPSITHGSTAKKPTSCGDLYLTINEDDNGNPFEVFANMGKAGGCEASQNEATGRLISLALRAGVEPDAIVKQLIGIRCNKPFGLGDNRVESCSDGIAKMMYGYLAKHKDYQAKTMVLATQGRVTSACPDCGCELQFGEGCEKCSNCGFSRCS
ncbi:MAG: vitamin B12-dependent ribonucleotide reductase [Nitrospirae bacterium]|nr:vitamin B12-dependent ribonucleotide reductase [Nitrospirota bacterium]